MKEYDEGYADGFAAGEDERHALRAENARLREDIQEMDEKLTVALLGNAPLKERITELEMFEQFAGEDTAHITKLREMLANVSRGVQDIHFELNVALVWLPAISAIRKYFRELEENDNNGK